MHSKLSQLEMDQNQSTRANLGATFELAEILGALSHALDITEGQPEGHCIRCCWYGVQIGEALGLTRDQLHDLFYTLLLKDLGCSSNAARICELYLTDDIDFKHDFKTIDDSLSSALRFVFSKTGTESGLAERFRAIVNIVQNGGKIASDLIETRCVRGADIAAKLHFNENVQNGIRALDEHWDGNGKPMNLVAKQIPLNANIALLCQVLDVFVLEKGKAEALIEVRKRSGSWFDPQLVEIATALATSPAFWASDDEAVNHDRVLTMEPAKSAMPMDENWLDDIAAAFAEVVDAKSPFTSDHSNRVTLYTDMIAEDLGFSAARRRRLRRAALLHDIGKLAVSNQVLDKPGKLDDAEFDLIKTHPGHSQRILEQVSFFRDIAPIAGAHHERLDGKGYPNGLKGNEICLDTRIVTVADVFDALTADRPYRSAMPIEIALNILEKDVDTAFDGRCVSALKNSLSKLNGTQQNFVPN